MNISGSGHIAAGEYNEKISVSGSGRITGNVRCVGLSCSGSVKADGSVEAIENVRASGSCHIEKALSAQNVTASGSMKVGEDINAVESVKISGYAGCGGSIKCANLVCSGSASVGGEIAAENIRISGRIECAGLMNAEKIDIDMGGAGITSHIGAIGGSEIKIYNSRYGSKGARLPLIKRLLGGNGSLCVRELIEGDVVALECVVAPKVVGRVVAIGDGCEIDLVQYSEEIEISDKAKVAKYEKI